MLLDQSNKCKFKSGQFLFSCNTVAIEKAKYVYIFIISRVGNEGWEVPWALEAAG